MIVCDHHLILTMEYRGNSILRSGRKGFFEGIGVIEEEEMRSSEQGFVESGLMMTDPCSDLSY